jgi:MraZ protein
VGEIGNSEAGVAELDAPRGFFKVSVDDKGRLKLPTAIVEYLQGLGFSKFFITTLDLKEVRIYPLPAWKETEKMLYRPGGDDFDMRQDLALVAYNYGKDEELDAQGRLTLPADLRKELGLEKDETRVRWYQGYLKLVSSREHEQRMAAARTGLDGKYKAVQNQGI